MVTHFCSDLHDAIKHLISTPRAIFLT